MLASTMASSMCWPPAPFARATSAAQIDCATCIEVTLSHTAVATRWGTPSASDCTVGYPLTDWMMGSKAGRCE